MKQTTMVKSSAKKRKPKATLQSQMKRWKHKLDFEENVGSDDDDDDGSNFGFNDQEAKEEISYSHNAGDEDSIAELAPFLQPKFQPPLPDYAQLSIFEEKSNCDQCWGCLYRFGASRIRSKNSTADKIFNEFLKNKTDLPLEALCILLQEIQAELVWRPSVKAVMLSKKGVAVEPWPADIVMSHLVDHIQDPGLKMKSFMRDAALIEKALKNTLIKYETDIDGTRKATPVFQNILSYIRFNTYQIHVSTVFEKFKGADNTKKN